jgi:hypothetical protein
MLSKTINSYSNSFTPNNNVKVCAVVVANKRSQFIVQITIIVLVIIFEGIYLDIDMRRTKNRINKNLHLQRSF